MTVLGVHVLEYPPRDCEGQALAQEHCEHSNLGPSSHPLHRSWKICCAQAWACLQEALPMDIKERVRPQEETREHP